MAEHVEHNGETGQRHKSDEASEDATSIKMKNLTAQCPFPLNEFQNTMGQHRMVSGLNLQPDALILC